MAVNGPAGGREFGPERERSDVLARAADSMREITDEGWVQIRDSVLSRVLRTVRPSRHVAGQHEDGAFTVATAILVSRIRAVLESRDGQVQVLDVGCAVDAEGRLESVNVTLSIRFGASISQVTARARSTAADVVSRTLGLEFPARQVIVDLHIADVHPAP